MKVALISGASSGVGAASARHLAKAGYRVVLVARRQAELVAVAAQIGSGVIVEACDASSGEQVQALAERVRREAGVPDVVVNAAGAGAWKYIEETSPDEAVAMIRAPYLAAFNLSHIFMAEMLARRSGVLIQINSPAAFFPWPSSVGYTASRWALRGLHEALCQDLAGTGVRSCHLVLGRVASPYFDHNPGTLPKIPRIAHTVRTLSVDECGRLVSGLAQKPRRQVFHPPMLAVYAGMNRLMPRMVRAMMRWTGAKRSDGSQE